MCTLFAVDVESIFNEKFRHKCLVGEQCSRALAQDGIIFTLDRMFMICALVKGVRCMLVWIFDSPQYAYFSRPQVPLDHSIFSLSCYSSIDAARRWWAAVCVGKSC